MRHFLESVLEEDRHLYEKDGHIIVLEKGKDARVAIDRSAMRMVLANLLENAARYSPRGSKIRLKLHRDLRSCRLDVIDSGDGIQKGLKTFSKCSGEVWGICPRARNWPGPRYVRKNVIPPRQGPASQLALPYQRVAAAFRKYRAQAAQELQSKLRTGPEELIP
jgi:hypothetical protein